MWGKQISPDFTMFAFLSTSFIFILCLAVVTHSTSKQRWRKESLSLPRSAMTARKRQLTGGWCVMAGHWGILNTHVQLRTLAYGPPDWQRMGLHFVVVGSTMGDCELKIIVRLVFISCQCIFASHTSSRKCLNTSAETTLGNLHS